MTITTDLMAVSKKLTQLANKAEKLAVAIGKTGALKAKPIQTKTKAKAVTKKTPPKAGKGTDTDKVLAIINRSKKDSVKYQVNAMKFRRYLKKSIKPRDPFSPSISKAETTYAS